MNCDSLWELPMVMVLQELLPGAEGYTKGTAF